MHGLRPEECLKKFLDIAGRFQVKRAITYTTLLIIDYRLTAAHGCGCDGQAEAELQGIEPISLKDLARRASEKQYLARGFLRESASPSAASASSCGWGST